MNEAIIVKRQLDTIGNTVYLQEGSWNSMPFKASLSRLWRRKNSRFEKRLTELGEVYSDYYLYVGPYNHNICDLSDEALLIYDGVRYEFKCKDPVKINDETIYYSAILRRITEADFDEN